jgi:cell division protein FtsW
VGCLFVLALFSVFLWRGLRAALKAPNRFGVFLGLGITSMIVIQALINISVAVTLFPTKGIPLPFISAGGTSLMITLPAVGVLLNISQHSN